MYIIFSSTGFSHHLHLILTLFSSHISLLFFCSCLLPCPIINRIHGINSTIFNFFYKNYHKKKEEKSLGVSIFLLCHLFFFFHFFPENCGCKITRIGSCQFPTFIFIEFVLGVLAFYNIHFYAQLF